MHADDIPVAPPGGANEFRLPPTGFGRNRLIDDLVTTASGYRFIDSVSLLVLSENGFLTTPNPPPGDQALIGAGIFPDSNIGTHYGQVINTNALKNLVTNGILGEALSLLAEVIPDSDASHQLWVNMAVGSGRETAWYGRLR